MLKTTILGLATAASLSLVAAALSPAFANYGGCTENPSATGYIPPAPELQGGAVKPAPRHMVQHVHNHQPYAPQKG
jgi:hypothetical protein